MPTRYAVTLKSMPSIGIAAVQMGVCPKGHDLTQPGTVSRAAGSYRCVPCWEAARGPALCRAGLHPLPAGVKRCRVCAKDAHEGPKDMSYLFVGLPPLEVIDGAACSPDIAGWFDPVEHGGRLVGDVVTGKLPQDTLKAMGVCSMCPVRAACLADAMEWRREGVHGGAYFTKRWHQAYRSALRNGTQPPAFRTLGYAERHGTKLEVSGTLDTPDTAA